MQQKKKEDPYKPGDIVTWKLWNQLIIKAEIGERRRHIPLEPPRAEREFYRPQHEHYLGQFPIDYQPEVFPALTEEEAKAMANKPVMPGQALEFNLMLNGSWVQASDRSIYSEEALDHPDQVKVILNPDYVEQNTKAFFEEELLPELDINSAESKNGITCYRFKGEDNIQRRCFGVSTNPLISGFEFYIPEFVNYPIYVNSRNETIYGGVKITWVIDRKNLDQAQAIDAAIWRLIDTWNISPFKHSDIHQTTTTQE